MAVIVAITLFSFLFKSALMELVLPPSPCPDTFEYNANPQSGAHGVMKLKNDFSGFYKVEVNMSVAAFTNTNIAIKLVTPLKEVQTGGDIKYHVSFPPTEVVPMITSIVFNDKLLCVSPNADEDFLVTSLHASNFFSTPRVPWPSMQLTGVTVPYSREKNQTQDADRQKSTQVAPITIGSIVEIENRYFNSAECGVAEDTQPLVVHGSPTTEGQYPWLTAMFHLTGKTGEYKFKCAANLVSTRHLITAAHCVTIQGKTKPLPKENVILVLGKHNIRSWAIRSEIRDVQYIYVHHDYVRPSDADIAVLVMYKTVEFTRSIKPVCLWEQDDPKSITGSEGTVVGWGRDEHDNAYVPEPRQLKMPVVSQEDCLRSDVRFLKLTSNRTFCAGTKKGVGACTGDSGGGFLIKNQNRWILRGIVSSALVDPDTLSCDVYNYIVFADVAKYLPWIKKIMAKQVH